VTGLRLATIALAAACATLGACSSHPTAEQAPSPFDGSYQVTFGLRTTLSGNQVPDTDGTVTWAARTACRDTGCITTATEAAPTHGAGDPRPPTMVFDYVDGRWISVTEVAAECIGADGKPITVSGWQTYVLEPKDDGTLTGTYTNRSAVGGACPSATQTVTLTRTGDAGGDVAVADPTQEAPRMTSPAAALWGRYRQVQTNPTTGQVYPLTYYAGNTACLRTGDRCLSYLVDPDSHAVLVMTFADGQWTSTGAPTDTTCPDGTPSRTILTGEYALPQRLSDPIDTLTGTQRTAHTGSCAGTQTVDVTLSRLGDGPGRLP
jgi:hypothetical protein